MIPLDIHITAQGIITASAVVAASIALIGLVFKVYDWYKKQTAQNAEIQAVKEEQAVIVYGLLACLKGLQEKGCNGPVTEAINKLEKHLNKEAHR